MSKLFLCAEDRHFNINNLVYKLAMLPTEIYTLTRKRGKRILTIELFNVEKGAVKGSVIFVAKHSGRIIDAKLKLEGDGAFEKMFQYSSLVKVKNSTLLELPPEQTDKNWDLFKCDVKIVGFTKVLESQIALVNFNARYSHNGIVGNNDYTTRLKVRLINKGGDFDGDICPDKHTIKTASFLGTLHNSLSFALTP